MSHRHILHDKTVAELQEELLKELTDGGFADKRTELEVWCDAVTAAKRNRVMFAAAYDLLTTEQKTLVRKAVRWQGGVK